MMNIKNAGFWLLFASLSACQAFTPGVETENHEPESTSPDASAPDTDLDGVSDTRDNCTNTRNPNQADFDGDGTGDLCDGCPTDPLRVYPTELNPCATLVEPEEPDAGHSNASSNSSGGSSSSSTSSSSSSSVSSSSSSSTSGGNDAGTQTPDAGSATYITVESITVAGSSEAEAEEVQSGDEVNVARFKLTAVGDDCVPLEQVTFPLIRNQEGQNPFTAIQSGSDGNLQVFTGTGIQVGIVEDWVYGNMHVFFTRDYVGTSGGQDYHVLNICPGYSQTITLRGTIRDNPVPGTLSVTAAGGGGTVYFEDGHPVRGSVNFVPIGGDFPLGDDDEGSNWIRVVPNVEVPDAGQTAADAGMQADSGSGDAGTQQMGLHIIPNGPESQSIPGGTSNAVIMSFIVKNETNDYVLMTSLLVERFGVLAGNAVTGLMLLEHNSRQHGALVTFGGNQAVINFPSDPFVVYAGQEITVDVSVMLSSNVTSGSIGLKIPNHDSITFVDGNSNSVQVTNEFPIVGNLMNVVSGTGALGAISVETVSIIGGTQSTPIGVDLGSQNIDLGMLKLQETTGNENVGLCGLTVVNNGSALLTDFNNLSLYDGEDNRLLARALITPNGFFFRLPEDLSRVVIMNGTYKSFRIRADIEANAEVGRTFNFVVSNDFKVLTRGETTGVGVSVYAGNNQTFPIGDTDPGSNWSEIRVGSLAVSRSTAFSSTDLVRGGTLQKIGSFDLRAFGEGFRINAAKIRVCPKNGTVTSVVDCDAANSADLAAVTNVTLQVPGGPQLAPSQNITTTAGGTFSMQYEFAANITGVIEVWAVVYTSFTASNLAVSLTVTSATGLQSQNTVSKPEVLGQSLTVVNSGTLSFTSLGTDGVVNVAKLVHASEVGIKLFKFKVREPTNSENVSLGKVYFGVKNAVGTFQNYKLFNEATSLPIGSQTDAIILSGTSGEVRFGGLNQNITKGGELNLYVQADVVDASAVAASNYDVTIGITFTEFTGAVSGVTTRESGGLILGQSTSDVGAFGAYDNGGDFIVVNDVADFEVGDAVHIDVNNDGDYSIPVSGAYVESMDFQVETVGQNTITLAFQGQRVDFTGMLVSGCRISKYLFTSYNHEVHEVEPVMTGLNVGAGNQVSENEVGVFVIRNEGNRSIKLHELQFEVSGSYDVANGYGPRDFKLDRADPTTGVRIANSLNAGAPLGYPQNNANDAVINPATVVFSGTVIEFSFAENGITEEIGAGSSKAYVVVANTTNIKNNGVSGSTATTQLRMLGSRASPAAGSNDGLTWSYIRTSNGNSSGLLTISDSYIVSGKALLYQ